MSLSDYTYIKDLGKGAFGVVCLAEEKFTKTKVAIKRVKIKKLSKNDRQNALNEVRILASLQHSNLIDYSLSFFDEASSTLNIVMEYCNKGDLAGQIKENLSKNTPFKESEIWSVLLQAINALEYLKENKVIHRDIKPANIFLQQNGAVKLGDMNVAKLTKLGNASTQTGTPYYAAPEIWSEKEYSYGCDVWSLGCTIYEMAALKPPFDGKNLKELFKNVQKGSFEALNEFYSKELRVLIGKMLVVDPALRIEVEEVLKDEIYLSKINSDYIRSGKEISLLKTIEFNSNLKELNRKLPKRESGVSKSRVKDGKKSEKIKTLKEAVSEELSDELKLERKKIILEKECKDEVKIGRAKKEKMEEVEEKRVEHVEPLKGEYMNMKEEKPKMKIKKLDLNANKLNEAKKEEKIVLSKPRTSYEVTQIKKNGLEGVLKKNKVKMKTPGTPLERKDIKLIHKKELKEKMDVVNLARDLHKFNFD